MAFNVDYKRVDWVNSVFLLGTLFLALTATPIYIYFYGVRWWEVVFGLLLFFASGISITLGYHRLFSHRAFKANNLVKFFCIFFGAGAFEGSVITWSSDHRRHHKHVDEEQDPYNIKKGFWHAHIGWILFKVYPEPPLDNVKDLFKDRLVIWQHFNWRSLGIFVGFILPTIIGYIFGYFYDQALIGALGGLLVMGVLKLVLIQHCTFFINSLCHMIGSQTYDKKCSARDSWIMAIPTLGEGYHNYHHKFQYDYRNGIRPWHIDPTKWIIWVLYKLGMAKNLKRVPEKRIKQAKIAATGQKTDTKISESA